MEESLQQQLLQRQQRIFDLYTVIINYLSSFLFNNKRTWMLPKNNMKTINYYLIVYLFLFVTFLKVVKVRFPICTLPYIIIIIKVLYYAGKISLGILRLKSATNPTP